ncbi:MAG: hypothetical protein ACU4F9_11685 [Arcticibacter sp.]
MIRILILILIGLANFTCSNNVLGQSVQGIGIFKVNQFTKIDFISWLDSQNVKLEEITSSAIFFEMDNSLKVRAGSLKPNQTKKYDSPSQANYLKGFEVIYLNDYEVSGIAIDQVYLLFLNDTLAKITFDLTSEIEKALSAKYGEPVKDVKTKEIECVYSYTGAKNIKEEVNVKLSWRDNDFVAYGYRSTYYDAKCKPQVFSFFVCYDKAKAEEYSSRNRDAEKLFWSEKDKQSKDELKKKLDDF